MAFIEEKHNEIIYMRSDKLKAHHGFLTRFGGVSEGAYASLNLGSNRGDVPERVRENYRRAAELAGASVDGCVVTNQVHKNQVRIVTSEDKHICMSGVPYEADGIVTGEKNLPVFCFTADCVPVLLWDEENKAVGAIHCGWRSSVGDILKNAVEQMEVLGAKPEKIHAAVGPAIGFCCFETGDEVPQAVSRYLNGDTEGIFRKKDNGKTLVDLREANRRRLVSLGLKDENIDISDECTMCCHEKYWSHRYTKGVRGSQAAFITLR